MKIKGKLKTNNKIRQFFIIIILFWIMYTPVANIIGPALTQVSFIIIFICLLYMAKKYKINFWNIIFKSGMLKLIVMILISAMYIYLRASLGGYDGRIIQNTTIIIQSLTIVLLFAIMYYGFDYSVKEILDILLKVVIVQAFIAIAMIFMPGLKNVALHLYYAGGTENIWINATRIYGLSSEYTFTTPIMNALIGAIALVMSIEISKKYLIMIPPILLLVVLNGRTGIMIFTVASVIVAGYYMFIKLKIVNALAIMITITAFFFAVLVSVEIFSPVTYKWIVSAFVDTSNTLKGNTTGNYASLGFVMPDSKHLFWGYGFRAFDLYFGTKIFGLNATDIGYSNDLYLGGIMYIILLYTPIYIYILKVKNKHITYGKLLGLLMLVFLLIANYKGETMRNGNLLVLILSIATMLKFPEKNKENVNGAR